MILRKYNNGYKFKFYPMKEKNYLNMSEEELLKDCVKEKLFDCDECEDGNNLIKGYECFACGNCDGFIKDVKECDVCGYESEFVRFESETDNYICDRCLFNIKSKDDYKLSDEELLKVSDELKGGFKNDE